MEHGETHVVLGAGQIGSKLAERLLARGHRVRLVRRGPPGPARDGLSWCQGDITDPALSREVCHGAQVIYGCTNPSNYARWHGVLEPLVRATLAAARDAGARLVLLDNLYMYGAPAGPLREDSPMTPCSPKGQLRAEMAREALAARDAGLELAIGRAADYIGPSTPSSVALHDRALARLRAGKPVEVTFDPDTPHAYAYSPDVAEALARLGENTAAMGEIWHLPVAWSGTTRELYQRLAAVVDRPARVRRVPTWAMRAIGLVSPLVRAIHEMSYLWDRPFLVDDSRFRRTFGMGATPMDEVARVTMGRGASSANGKAPLDSSPACLPLDDPAS